MCVAKDFKLTDKQFAFCQEYLENRYNATEAYRKVYQPKSEDSVIASMASRMLKNVNVRACINKLLADLQFDKNAIIAQCIQAKLDIIAGKTMQKRIDKDTGKVIEFAPTARDINDACNDLMKLFGAYTETTTNEEDEDVEALNVSNNESKNIEVKGFDDESK